MARTFLDELKTHVPIGIGTMGLGGYYSRDETDDATALDALSEALGQGLTIIDTAEVYGAGHAEELVGDAIKERREDVVLCSKVSPENLHAGTIRRSLEASLKRLKTDYLDLYFIHWPNPAISIKESIDALKTVRAEGLIRHIGLSNFSMPEIEAAVAELGDVPLAAVQAEYNLFDRSVEADVLPYCREAGVAFFAYSPLDVGRLGNAGQRQCHQELADSVSLTPAQLALRWVVRGPNVVAIPKASKRAHIRENAAALRADIPDAVFEKLTDGYPFQPILLDPKRVRVDDRGLENFVPGPQVLASALRDGAPLKPIRVRPLEGDDTADYELVEGKLRYWAWCYARTDGAPIPALVRDK